MQKIIYIYPNKSTFVKNDISFLKKNYIIKEQQLTWVNALKLPYNLFAQLLFLLRNINTAQVIIVNFGGYFSLLPTVLGKLYKVPTFIILNGTDSVSFPKYNYGSLRKPLLRFFIKKTYQNATKLLPVDNSLLLQNHTFDKKVRYTQQGIYAFFSDLKTPVQIIPNGFDTHFWRYNIQKEKEKDFLTVVAANTKNTAIFKGVDLCIQVAKKFTDKTFTIVGLSKKLQQELDAPTNIIFYPFVSKEELKKIYQNHKYYLQLSINEGFGCAVAEAMLCGCVPIVSNSGALPNLIGNSGFVVKKRTIKNICNTINTAIQSSVIHDKKSMATRQRIIDNFAISKREQLFLQEIHKVI